MENMENMENLEQENVISLTDEQGNETEFVLLDVLDYQDKEYIVLLPLEESDEGDSVIILQIEPVSDEEESYVSVDDQDTLMAVFEIFKEKFKDEFNFVD